MFRSLSGLQADSLIRHASQSDVEGVTLGDDLNSLLPVEYCYLTDEVLHPFFMQRYVEKRLQQFDSFSHEDTSNPSPEKKKVSSQGPYIICVDTSGSMREERERLAKSAVLAIARLTEATSRKCYVINFSEDIRTLLIRDLKTDFPMLVDFLQRRSMEEPMRVQPLPKPDDAAHPWLATCRRGDDFRFRDATSR